MQCQNYISNGNLNRGMLQSDSCNSNNAVENLTILFKCIILVILNLSKPIIIDEISLK